MMYNINFIVIDDDYKEISGIIRVLDNFAAKYNISFIIYSPNNDEELDAILQFLEFRDYSGIIIDQRLGDHSFITLQGIQIAERLRNINESLPIFILTKYIGDETLLRFGFSIDDAIEKSQIVEYPEAFLGRLLRSVKRYALQNEELSKKLDELIKISYGRELSEQENDQLVEIKLKFMPTGLIDGALRGPSNIRDDELTNKLSETLEILDRIDKERKA